MKRPGPPEAIEGYANATSVLPGEKVKLYVSTTAHKFVAQAFRMGWYHHKDAASLVWTSKAVRGRLQPRGRMQSRRMIETHWQRSMTVSTAGWLPGDYLFRLDSSQGYQRYVPLTIRAHSARGRVVLISAVTTWQAYNLWGCCDLYNGGDGSFGSRSRAVSFDRPYEQQDGSGEFLIRQFGILGEAERLGLKLDYITDVDLVRHHILRDAAAAISMGHDEYYSPRMRHTLTRARNHGSNLAFFGANAIFRRIRYTHSHLGSHRVEINYKIASEDPLYGKDNRRVTADWPSPPDARPESSLIGEQYGCFSGSTRAAGRVAHAGAWVWAGTGAHDGTDLPGLVGPELDAVQPGYPAPPNVKVLMRSPVHCPSGYPNDQNATLYVARSGARVFDAGTIEWACDINGGCYASGPTRHVVRIATDNVLRNFSVRR